MRTRLLLPETAVPVHEQDGGKQYDWEHHVSWTSWLRASCMNMILENIKVMNKMTKSILKRTYSSVHEHDDGEHHVHEHDHCEHHEHEHPVHEQNNWVHHRHEQHNGGHHEPDDWAHHTWISSTWTKLIQNNTTATLDHPCRSPECEQKWMILIITETKENLFLY